MKREDLRFIEAVSKVCGEVEEVSGYEHYHNVLVSHSCCRSNTS